MLIISSVIISGAVVSCISNSFVVVSADVVITVVVANSILL